MSTVPTPTTAGDSPATINAAEMGRALAAALVRAGATEPDAVIQAAHLVEGELRGHASHGIRRLTALRDRLRAGLITSGIPPTLGWTGASALAVDGNNGFGPVVAHTTIGELLPRAASNGIAIATIRRNHHLGMLSPYVERIAEAGLIGIVLTTAGGGVHPWGGALPLVGTNPIAIGVPSGDSPLVLDMSTAAVTKGLVLDYAARGQALPPGVAVDPDGRPTTDAAAAAEGAISPFGGAKGYALGIAFGAIVGLLTRTSYGADVAGLLDSTHPVTKGDVFIAISPAAFGASANDAALAGYFDLVRASAPEGSTVSIPGDRTRATRARRRVEGIPVDATMWQTVLELAKDA